MPKQLDLLHDHEEHKQLWKRMPEGTRRMAVEGLAALALQSVEHSKGGQDESDEGPADAPRA